MKPAALITPAESNPFGFYVPPYAMNANMQAFVDTLSQANIGWVRTLVSWSGAEPSQGSLTGEQLTNLKDQLTLLQSKGIKAYVQLRIDAPGWAGGTDGISAPSCDHFADWESYVYRVVGELSQYGVRHFAIHNEPEWSSQFTGNCSGWYGDYLNLTRMAARAIHSYGPEYKVIVWEGGTGPEIFNYVLPLLNTLRSMASQAGEPEPADIVAFHHYAGAQPPNDPYFLNSAGWVLDDMRNVANQLAANGYANKEFWLTEFGTDPLGQVWNGNFGTREQRNVMSVVLSQFIVSRPAQWTKIFTFNDELGFGWTKGLNGSEPLSINEAFWAYGYLARRYGGDAGAIYAGFQYDNRTWYDGSDFATVPPTPSTSSNGIWGERTAINWWLQRAGVMLCASYHYQFVGWLGGGPWCNGPYMEPIEFGGQPHNLEAIQFRMYFPLPTYTKNWVSMCGQANVSGIGWQGATCSTTKDGSWVTIGTTGQTRPIKQFRMWLSGDVR